jgi:diguanylate cyclase (GGDEF)-like protein
MIIDRRRRDTDATGEISEAAAQIERVLRGGFRSLQFPKAVEALFESRQRVARDRHFIVICLLGIVVQNLFLFTDIVLIPDVFLTALKIRLVIVTGWLLLCMVPIALHPPVWLREILGASGALVVAAAILYLANISIAPTAVYHPVGLVLIPMFGCIAVRLRFWYALGVSALTLLAALLFAPSGTPAELIVKQSNLLVLASATMFTLLACYRLEHQDRRNFLLTELDREQREALASRNAQLRDLTTLDPLTGIYNRRQFENYLDMRWQRAEESDTSLALLMIDVDFFKPFNDSYGHPEGDACLKRIALTLTSVARRHNALVARVGGEEFVAIAAGLDLDQAREFGEALRLEIEQLAIPHRSSSVADHVTVSIGVAAGRVRHWQRPQMLVDIADQAVYQAKSAGRNRVRAAVEKPVISVIGGRDRRF